MPLTPTLAIVLKPTTAPAFTDGHVMITGETADGTAQVVELGGFAVVTNRHDRLEFHYKTISAANTTLVRSADGGMDEKTSAGKIVGHIDPASAIDSTGVPIPASYSYDSTNHEIVVQADTTHAIGAVFIDPSWRCWAVAGAYGAGWVVAAAAWIFTDGGTVWAAWALRAWFGLSFNAADAVARACTLH